MRLIGLEVILRLILPPQEGGRVIIHADLGGGGRVHQEDRGDDEACSSHQRRPGCRRRAAARPSLPFLLQTVIPIVLELPGSPLSVIVT